MGGAATAINRIEQTPAEKEGLDTKAQHTAAGRTPRGRI